MLWLGFAVGKSFISKGKDLMAIHSEVLSSIYKFDSKNTGDKESHWFKVEMIGINDENTDLLDFTQIKEYLSFVAPVPYQNTFLFRAEVYKHAKEIGCNIDEYNIFLNGEQIFKKYKTIFKTSKGEDEVFNLAFKEIYDSHNHLLAWLWIGVSHFKAIISKECKMRLLDKEGDLDEGNTDIIDELPLDYSILEEIDYEYPAHNAYFGYMTRGCPRNCAFCAVKTLEPQYKNYIGIKHQIKYVDEHFGAQKDLLLMDNNVFASNCFEQIIDEIKDCGFGKGATYIPPNEYDVAIKNLKVGYNLRAYTKKIIKLYDEIAEKLSEDEAGEFYLRREERGLLYAETATYDEICTFDETIRPLYDKLFHKSKRVRYIDFNQGLDARLATDKRMKKLSEINIRPLRIAFDHYEQSEVYISAVKKAAKYGIMELSNYLLYNFEDEPKELYYRMRINVDLCEELGVTIYSFPMKYHPINDPEYFKNRDYLGKHWNRKFIRAVQAVLNSTKGKIGKGIEFFEEAFGRDLDEFYKILWMPETFIIYRRKYDKKLRERLADRYKNHSSEDCDLANEWWTKFCSLPAEKLEIAKSIISLNKFKEGDYDCTDKEILDVLSYYSITRDIAEQSI